MASEFKSVSLLLSEGFNKPGWHGPNLLTSLRGMTLSQLRFRPTPDVHNAWELAVHCAFWKHAIRKRLDPRASDAFPLKGSNFFARGERNTLADWKKDLALLKAQHKALEATIRALKPSSYDRRAGSSRHSVRRTILGIAAHDIYHAGQISLLHRMADDGDGGRGT